MGSDSYIREVPGGVTLALKVQPRAPRDEICDVAGAELRVKISAPPVDAAANHALLRFLAEKLDCPRSGLELIRGGTSRHKIVRIAGMDAATARDRLQGKS
jgi:uncharacterized protein (TIGR00251 family)